MLYTGDEGGILCALESSPNQKNAYVVSITHLRIPDDNPLAKEIKAYQQKRIIKLAINDGKRGKALRMAKRNRKKRGFA